MFTNDVGMNVVRIDAAESAQQAPEPRRVQGGAGPEDSPGGHAAVTCEARGKMRHHVHGIRGNNEHGLGNLFENRGDNLVKNLSVSFQKLKPSFPRPLPNPRTQDDNPTAGQVFVIAGPDVERMRKGHGMADVIRFSGCPSGVLVHQDNLSSHPLHDQGVRGSGAHKAASDNAYLHRGLLRCKGRYLDGQRT
jgi:hypothetical protein